MQKTANCMKKETVAAGSFTTVRGLFGNDGVPYSYLTSGVSSQITALQWITWPYVVLSGSLEPYAIEDTLLHICCDFSDPIPWLGRIGKTCPGHRSALSHVFLLMAIWGSSYLPAS